MIETIIKVSTIFVMIAIGYAACKSHLIKPEAQNHLTSLLLNINIPCMLIYSITQNEISSSMMRITVFMLICSCAYFVIAAAVSIPVVKLLGAKANEQGIYKIIFTSTNAGFIGFPVTQTIFGSETLYFMVIHNIVLNVYLYSLCIMQLRGINSCHRSKFNLINKMINPCIISALVGIVILFAGVHVPEYINGILEPIGEATIPTAMILVGIQLSEGNIMKCVKDRKLVLFCVIRMFLWQCAVVAIMIILPVYQPIKIVIVLGAALPSASIISALAANEDGDYKLAANGIVITTLLSIISIPFSTSLIYGFL